jgi:uncharacterized protein
MKTSTPKHTNLLINESSPYLLQHAHNPVNWQAWNDKALGEAKMHDKLLIVSVGYAACHWCHVMEHESFEDEEVARIMNTHFINIKVDREERPDLDQIYMDACQLINGNGGWPLNAIALPDGRPIFAGTYFKNEDWKKLLLYFADLYPIKKSELEERAEQIRQGIQSLDRIELNLSDPEFAPSDLDEAWQTLKNKIDFSAGGTMGAPKFPMPAIWDFLLKYQYFTKNEEALAAVSSTLDNMMMGGIYDHVAGGFARYSVDGIWKVPHFEKMLYDNGQLVSLYAQAYAATGNEAYKTVAEETIAWLKNEMTDESGGFYSALDADSEGVEGKFYVWEDSELDDLLGKDAELLKKYWSVEKHGNWEEGNILFAKNSVADFCKKYNLNESSFQTKLKSAKKILLLARNKRVRPGLDDKILTSWNALMLKGLVDAYRYLGNSTYLEMAEKNALFLTQKLKKTDGGIYRNYKNGKATINGFLDDYSFTIEALLALYEVTGNEDWLVGAEHFANYTIRHFYNHENGMFYYTSDLDRALVTRKTEVSDNVIPSSNSSLAKGLFLLSKHFDKEFYHSLSVQMLHNMKENTTGYSQYYSNWAILMSMMVHQPDEVVITGEKFNEFAATLQQNYIPDAMFAIAKNAADFPLFENRYVAGKTMIYVCKNKTCNMPVSTTEIALKQILDGKK